MSNSATPTSIKRQLRTSNPTPPGKTDIKRYKTDSDQSNMEPESTVNPSNLTLSDTDVERIALAVEAKLGVNLINLVDCMVEDKLKPVHAELQLLRNENQKLKYKLDDLEQYGRRSLMRVSGIPEVPGEDTTELVCKLFAEIDPNFNNNDVDRSHRNGPAPPAPATPADNQQSESLTDGSDSQLQEAEGRDMETVESTGDETEASNVPVSTQKPKPRQIMVRVTNPSVKLRILKCRKNLKNSSNYSNVYINEDLTRLRSKLFWHVRQLAKHRQIKQFWTTNGKIFVKDATDKIHSIQSTADFNLVTVLTGIRYDYLSLDNL